jgi:hypothetical protein
MIFVSPEAHDVGNISDPEVDDDETMPPLLEMINDDMVPPLLEMVINDNTVPPLLEMTDDEKIFYGSQPRIVFDHGHTSAEVDGNLYNTKQIQNISHSILIITYFLND